jgi:hypothetical protein
MRKNRIATWMMVVMIFTSSCVGPELPKSGDESAEDLVSPTPTLDFPSSYTAGAVFFENNLAYVGFGDCVFILQFNNPSSYQEIGNYCRLANTISHFERYQDRLYATAGNQLVIFDTRDASQIKLIGTYQASAAINDLAIDKKNAFLAVGESGVQIVDISDPSQPDEGVVIDTPGTANGLDISDSRLYLADGKAGVQVFDLRSPENPLLINQYQTEEACDDIAVLDGRAYITAGDLGMQVVSFIDDQPTPVLVGGYDTQGSVVSVKVSDQKVYVIDSKEGLIAFDIMSPEFPSKVGVYDDVTEIADFAIDRGIIYLAARDKGFRVLDMYNPDIFLTYGDITFLSRKEFEQKYRISYLIDSVAGYDFKMFYTLSGEIGELHVIDKTNLDDIKRTGILSLGSFGDMKINHTIGDYLYLIDISNTMVIIDISNPADPSIVSSWDLSQKVRNFVVSGDFIYLIGDTGLQAWDLSNPESPSRVDLQNFSWSGEDIVSNENLLYVAAGADGLRIIDVQDPSSPVEVGRLKTAYPSKEIEIKGDQVYIADASTLHVVDVTDPARPVELNRIVDYERLLNMVVHKNLLLIYDASELMVYDISNPEMLVELDYEFPNINSSLLSQIPTMDDGLISIAYPFYISFDKKYKILDYQEFQFHFLWNSWNDPSLGNSNMIEESHIYGDLFEEEVGNISITGDFAFISTGNKVSVFDISDQEKPREIVDLDYKVRYRSLKAVVQKDLAYLLVMVNESKSGMVVLDISDMESPNELGSIMTPGDAVDLLIEGDYAYIADYEHGVRIVDISDPKNLVEVGHFDDSGQASKIVLKNNILYLAEKLGGFVVIDVSDPHAPKQIAKFQHRNDGQATAVEIVNDLAYVAWNSGLQIVDISDAYKPEMIFEGLDGQIFEDIEIKDNYAIFTERTSWGNSPSVLSIYDISNPKAPNLLSALQVADNAFIDDLVVKEDIIYVPVDWKLNTYQFDYPNYFEEVALFTAK